MIPEAIVTVNGEDISCDVLSGVSISHGRDRPGEQPDPATSQLEMITADGSLLDKLKINAILGVDARFPDGKLVRRFVGQITDVDLSWENVDLAHIRVLCASPVAILNKTFIGDTPWPQEIDGTRAARILSVVQAIPYHTFFDTGLDGWAAAGAGVSVSVTDGVMKIVWGPQGLQSVQRSVSGLLPGGNYIFSAVVRPGTAGTFLAVPPPETNGFGDSYRLPDRGWKTLSSVFSADANGDMLLQFWPVDANPAGGGYCYVDQVSLTAAHQVPVGQIDPGYVNILGRDVDRQPCLKLLQELAEDAGGLAWHTKSGAICYADAEHRRNTPVTVTLDCERILMAPQWSMNTGNLVNDTTVSYGVAPEGGEQPTVRAVDNISVEDFGRLATSQTTQLAALADAQFRADITIARQSTPHWDLPVIPIDLSLPAYDEMTTRAVLDLDVHSLLTVTGLPSQGPYSTTSLWVEGWEETIEVSGTVGNWGINLHVSDYCRTSAFVRWDDIPDAVLWDGVDPDLRWDDTYCFGPPAAGERWNNVPANLRWDGVPATVVWDEWNDYIGA